MIPDFYIEKMREIAHEWNCHLELDGEVGFGRECVGITQGNNYVDFSDYCYYFQETDPKIKANKIALYDELAAIAPDRAYHKHDCVAVLGTDDEAQMQLYCWLTELHSRGWKVGHELERDLGPGSMTMGEFLYGTKISIPILVKR